MIDTLRELAVFAVQLVMVAVVVVIVASIIMRRRGGNQTQGQLQVEDLSARYRQRHQRLSQQVSTEGKRKNWSRFNTWLNQRRKQKQGLKGASDDNKEDSQSRVWVLDFHGDLKASGAERLGEEVSALLDIAQPGDEVVLKLESPGGLVHAYGHAAAEFDRFRQSGITTTVCIDRVAASGGYLMACGADKLVAAPFAVLGSIGVVAQVPNIHRLLKRHDVDVEQHTAGDYKRTLTLLGENTEAGRQKFKEELDTVHQLFKDYVAKRRPGLDMKQIASGESWYGSDALTLGLIDELSTSEQYLAERLKCSRVIAIRLVQRSTLTSRLGKAVSVGLEKGAQRVIESLDASVWHKR